MPKEPEERKLSPVGEAMLRDVTEAVDIDQLLDGPIICFFGPNAKERYEELERARHENSQE